MPLYVADKQEQGQIATRTLYSADNRVSLNIYPGLPARVEVAHSGLSEEELEVVLMDMAAEIPSPCMFIILPQLCWDCLTSST